MTILFFMGLSILMPLVLGMPIALVLGLSGLCWLVALDPNLLQGAGLAIWNTASNDVLISIPLFILMGEIIQRAGVATRFYNAVSIWMRGIPGGLLHANISASALFAAVCGSSIATAASIGKAAIPNLLRLGYNRRAIFGSLAAGGTLGILIPPSIPLIIYAALVEASLGRLFLAAVIPGIIITLIFHAFIFASSFRRPSPATTQAEDRQSLLRTLPEILPLVGIIVTILGGIYYLGATTNEVAGIGIVISLIVAAVQGKLTVSVVREFLLSAAQITSMLVFIVIGAQIFSFAIFSWGVNQEVADWIGSIAMGRVWIILVIVAIYLLLGMFVDAISMMVLTLSVVYPIIIHLNYDPIWFGVILVLVLEIGLITPPVGLNLFTIQAVDSANINFTDVAKGAFPYVLLLLSGIGLLIAFPQIALWLPSTIFGS